MELSGPAVHDVRGCTSDRADRWTKHCIWNHGDWRTDKCDRICDSDSDVSEYGDFCICHDHDRRASTDRITEVLNEVPEMQDKADAVKEVRNGEITFEHVDFSYAGEGGNLSLKDINLHIKSGQTVASLAVPEVPNLHWYR